MNTNHRAVKKIVTFLAITLAISSVYYYLMLTGEGIQTAGGLLVFGLMWAPGIAGMITQLIYERSLRGLGWKPGKAKYLLLALIIPLGYCLVVYGVTWATGAGDFSGAQLLATLPPLSDALQGSLAARVAITIGVIVLVGLPSGVLSGMGEEIGWRGLFVPELAKVTSFTRAALISGGVWALWHAPLILFGGYNMAGSPRWYALLMFAIMVVGISFAFAWLRLKSGSFWPAALLHASHNLFVQAIFTPLTSQKPITPYIIDEFGVGLALLGVVVAWMFWKRRGEVEKSVNEGVRLSPQRPAGSVG